MDFEAVSELLRDYIKARFSLMYEWYPDFDRDRIAIVEDAKARAAAIGIEWSDDFVDSFEWDQIQRAAAEYGEAD